TLLMLAIDKAAALLGWRPVWSLDRAVQETIRWYRQRHQENRDMLPVSREQIDAYVTDARRAGAAWA
ncbi:MAG TPA: CDP-glucose 4,6-dehydratase, partial [Verrucomicrobiota bacterium]|nr:CDP-glucose 4,6-dehydratase [Verrucomicrobiota bacterium]